MGVETELLGIKNRYDGKEFRVIEREDGTIAVLAGDKVLVDSGVTPVTASPSGNVVETDIAGLKPFAVHGQPSGFDWPAWLPNIKAVRYGRRFECSHGPEDLIDFDRFTRTMYVDSRATGGGADANSGTSWANRKSSLGNAARAARASGIPTRILLWSDGGDQDYSRFKSIVDDSLERTGDVPLVIEAMDGRVKTGNYDILAWSKTAGYTNVDEAARTNSFRAANPLYPDIVSGIYKEYVWVSGADLAASLALVDATEGSWYTDGAKVYVHAHGHERAHNRNVRVYLSTPGLSWGGNSDLFIRGFDFEGGVSGNIRIRGGSTNKVILDDCTLRFAASGNTYNGSASVIDAAQILGVGLFAAFNSRFDTASKDGVNLHAEGPVIPSGLLVNCSATKNGLSPSQSNNGFTCHDGVKAISIGCTWTGNRGTNSGHVSDGTQVWSVGDTAGASAGDIPTGGGINYGGFGVWSGAAKMWLDSCRDVGAEIGVYGGSGDAAIYLRNHKGTGKRVGNVQSY